MQGPLSSWYNKIMTENSMAKKELPAGSRGTHVLLTRKTHPNIWIVRTKEDIDAIQKEDAEAGRYMDSAGEPLLYSPYGGWREEHGVSLTVEVKSRRAKWTHWNRKPVNLRTGWCPRLERTILFQDP